MKRLLPAMTATSALLILPGCLLVGGLLSGLSLVTTGPLQYASTAYTVAECSYEYAVNDKTPDQVLMAKLEYVFGGDEEGVRQPVIPATASEPVMLAQARPAADMPAPSPEQPEETSKPTALAARQLTDRESAREAVRETPRVAAASFRPAPAPLPVVVAQAKVRPQFIYVRHPDNPLRNRLSKMQQGLAAAERILLNRPENGIRCFVTNDGAGRTGVVVSGSWSIRHPVIGAGPDRDQDPSGALPSRALQIVSRG